MNLSEHPARAGPTSEARVVRFAEGSSSNQFDLLATEEPLEIRLRAGEIRRTVAITMRTPGNDFELAAGFLYSEGLLAGVDSIRGLSYCVDREADTAQQYNSVTLELAASEMPVLEGLTRHFTVTSACGICGRTSIEALRDRGIAAIQSEARLAAATAVALPERLRAAQSLFAATGGIHAAGLFDRSGALVALREDVGRHNALDKLIGWALLGRRLPLEEYLVVVSGRSSYELVAKAVAARIPILCSVSAPSSLAVALASEFNLTLVGFLRGNQFNVYAGTQRVTS